MHSLKKSLYDNLSLREWESFINHPNGGQATCSSLSKHLEIIFQNFKRSEKS
jgi:hypothetical protein